MAKPTGVLGAFALLFDEMPDGVCVTDGRGKILYSNAAARRLLEVTADMEDAHFCELLCGHLSTASSAECMSDCPLLKKGSGQKAVTFMGKHGLKQGFRWEGEKVCRFSQWKDVRVRCMRLPAGWFDSSESEKHLTLIEDISAEMELDRRKEAWRSMVAHDLRAPLTSILGSLACIDDIPAGRMLRSAEKELITAGLRSARRMLELVNDHLDLAKLDAGKMSVDYEDVALAEVAAECIKEIAGAAASRGISVNVDIAEGLSVRADRGLLFRVIQNLLSNAVKFTPEKGRVTLAGWSGSKSAYLSVRDTGVGIPEEELPFLFDRFHQVRARQAGRIQGTGLGLAFCSEALKAMGGSIRVKSKPEKGSEFTVQLPVGGPPLGA